MHLTKGFKRRSASLRAYESTHQEIKMRLLWMLSLSLILSSAGADELLWQKLQQDPNMIVLMRNSESNGNRDGAHMLVWDASGNCKGESTLTDEGKAHAQKIGAAFTKFGVKPIVISSPMCRCTETAVIAFGDYLTDPDLRQRSVEDAQGQESFQARARALLGRHRGRTPIVFVNHRPNIDSLTLELLNVGDLLVGTVTESGEVEVAGRIRVGP